MTISRAARYKRRAQALLRISVAGVFVGLTGLVLVPAHSSSAAIILPYDYAPTITSAASAQFPTNQDSTFTVTTTASPVPSLSESGALPAGVTFTDNGDGTATLAKRRARLRPGPT